MSTMIPSQAARYTLAIDDMTCGHCVRAVSEALGKVPGITVRSVAVGRAEIEAPDGPSVAAALAVVDDAGYPVRISESKPSSETPSQRACAGLADPGNARRGCCG